MKENVRENHKTNGWMNERKPGSATNPASETSAWMNGKNPDGERSAWTNERKPGSATNPGHETSGWRNEKTSNSETKAWPNQNPWPTENPCLNDPIPDPEKRVWMVRRKPGLGRPDLWEWDGKEDREKKNVFEVIRERVPAKCAAEAYGLYFRAGRARCPWHEDNHPDLAFYQDGTCYCHACHHGGDAADLTAQIFGLSMIGAVKKINEDFNLGLDLGRPVSRAERQKRERERAARRREEERRRREWAFLCAVRREADEQVRAAERPARDRDRLWDDPAFQTALSRRARADNELDREVTQL